jgi:hypothetical protein
MIDNDRALDAIPNNICLHYFFVQKNDGSPVISRRAWLVYARSTASAS